MIKSLMIESRTIFPTGSEHHLDTQNGREKRVGPLDFPFRQNYE